MKPTGQDPHRTLGIPSGAGEAEIKRAYRALAKRYHPDAREGSAARFIEIQAAYEALLGTAAPGASPAQRPGRRPAQAGGAGPRAGSGAGAPAGSAWARRSRDTGGRRPRPPASGGAGARAGQDRSASGGSSSSAGGSWTGSAGGHAKRRATFGSTSYDEAEEVFEPSWAGGAWYGASTGTYWTINPKEYADPRKHGPEYQARARRRAAADEAAAGGGQASREAAGAASGGTGGDAPGAPPTDAPPGRSRPTSGPAPPGAQRARNAAPGRPTPGDLPPDWRTQAWTAAGPREADRPTFEHEPAPAAPPAGRLPRPAAGDLGDHAAATDSAAPTPSAAVPATGPGVAARVAIALAGWIVPGLALAALAGLPGGLVATLPLQLGGVTVLAFQPRLAWAAAGGGLALVFAAIPIVAVVAALGGPVAPGEPMPAAAALGLAAWGGGVVAVGSGRVVPFPWRLDSQTGADG